MVQVRGALWYSPWPVLGNAKLSAQYGNLRINHEEAKATIRASLLEVDDTALYFQQERVLTGLEFGELSAKKKFKAQYDRSDGSFAISRNTGTDYAPVWVDDISISSAGVVTLSGGITVAGDLDMNNNDILQVDNINTTTVNNLAPHMTLTESGGGTESIADVTTLRIDTSTGLYITENNDGDPLLSTAIKFGRAIEREFSSSVEWEVSHNFGRVARIVATWDDRDKLIQPDEVYTRDPNKVYFYFSEAVAGTAIVATGGVGSQSWA